MRATDASGNYGTATVVVSVTDVNDNAPLFTPWSTTVDVRVQEGTEMGTVRSTLVSLSACEHLIIYFGWFSYYYNDHASIIMFMGSVRCSTFI